MTLDREPYSDRALARREDFLERAAILEWDGGLPHELAVRTAFALVYDVSRRVAGPVMDRRRVEKEGEQPEGRRGKVILMDMTTGQRYGRSWDGARFKFAPEGQMPAREEWLSDE